MFSWMTRSRSGPDDDPAIEPETPAPVFVFRAFRHALVGTPRPIDRPDFGPAGATKQIHDDDDDDDDRDDDRDHDRTRSADLADRARGAGKTPATASTSTSTTGAGGRMPHGILMTPGAGTPHRRKSVSFGGIGSDDGSDSGGKTGAEVATLKHMPGKMPGAYFSPFVGTPAAAAAAAVPEPSIGDDVDEDDTKKQKKNESYDDNDNASDSDSTVDLEQPKSQSGVFWKRHFDEYARRTDDEVGALIRQIRTMKDRLDRQDNEIESLRGKLADERAEAERVEARLVEQVDEWRRRAGEAEDEVRRVSGGRRVEGLAVTEAETEARVERPPELESRTPAPKPRPEVRPATALSHRLDDELPDRVETVTDTNNNDKDEGKENGQDKDSAGPAGKKVWTNKATSARARLEQIRQSKARRKMGGGV